METLCDRLCDTINIYWLHYFAAAGPRDAAAFLDVIIYVIYGLNEAESSESCDFEKGNLENNQDLQPTKSLSRARAPPLTTTREG